MQRKINCILILTIIAFIDHSFSAIFFPFEARDPEVDYRNSKSESAHRGLVLSYSLPKKKQICRDLFSAYYQESTAISDGLKNTAEPQHPLVLRRIRSFMPDTSLPDASRIDEMGFVCSGKDLLPNDEKEYFVSSAFQRRIMYTSEVAIENNSEIVLKNYLGMSPEYVSLDQMKLEKQYVEIRETIRGLRAESPAYVELIEGRDSISELSVWQKFLLCSSVLLSPEHEEDRREFPFHWAKYRESAQENIHLYQRECLSFEDTKYQSGNWCTDCLYCRDTAKKADDPAPTNLLLTRAYDDEDSLYVVIERKGEFFLKEYIKNVSIFINARVPFTNDPRKLTEPESEKLADLERLKKPITNV